MTHSNTMQRRQILQSAAALSLLGLAGCATTSMPSKAKVVVVGGGFGGATAAKYVRLLSQYKIDVVLIEPNASFISCPVSNMVLGGHKKMADITSSYEHLAKKHGVTVVQDMVSSIDAAKKTVTLARGGSIEYDKLVVSPGIDLMMSSTEGLAAANASGQIVQAWKAGAETAALRKQLEAIGDWSAWLAQGDEPQELEVLRRNADKGLPCGSEKFIRKLEKLTGRELQYRPRGRPRKDDKKG